MRIGIAADYGKHANASSLNLIARKVFLELGKLMNEKKTFTVAAIKYHDIGIGDVNQHFDCVNVPNMGGYRFPPMKALTSNNLSLGVVGIDEVVLREQAYETTPQWRINKPIIEREVPKWEKYIDKIRFIHASTNSDKEQFTKYLKIPEKKIHVIPYGVDHEIFKPNLNKEVTRKKILSKFFLKDSPYFIHVSEANWARKNIFRMLDAYELAKSKGIKHSLIIVGKIKQPVIDRASHINGVIVLGFVSEGDLATLMQCADALILPSLHEGFGFPLVESMACGVPAITSNVFSPPEIVGNAGLLVDPYNVSEIADKMNEISTNKTLQETLSVSALERSKSFSWEHTAKKLLQSMEQTTKQTSRDFRFFEDVDVAAYRTIATVCEILPELHMIRRDLLGANYSPIISWALEHGLEHPEVKDFLIPFKDWLISHSDEKYDPVKIQKVQ
jgi:glycosyltransferase involved in cell wall biosynthesis